MPPRSPQERAKQRKQAYRTALMDGDDLSAAGRVIMNDLAKFCRAHKSTSMYSAVAGAFDPMASAQAEGRREVWLRILEHLHLEDRFITNIREQPEHD